MRLFGDIFHFSYHDEVARDKLQLDALDDVLKRAAMQHCMMISTDAELRVEINYFKPLYLGRIEVDSAEFWTVRSLPASSRSTPEEFVSKPSNELMSKFGRTRDFRRRT